MAETAPTLNNASTKSNISYFSIARSPISASLRAGALIMQTSSVRFPRGSFRVFRGVDEQISKDLHQPHWVAVNEKRFRR
jgi:hypothetical protein